MFRFVLFVYSCFCVSGWVAFRLLGFCGIYMGLCGFCGFSFRILLRLFLRFTRLLRLWLFASSALPVPLLVLAAFWLWLFASSAFPVGFLDRDLITPLFRSSLFRISWGGAATPPKPPRYLFDLL